MATGLALLLIGSGCASTTLSTGLLMGSLSYQPTRSTNRIGVTVRLELSHTLGPKMLEAWKSWVNDETIANYRQAVVNVMANDIVESGMFTRVEPNPESPDFIVQLVSEEILDPQPTLVINEKVLTPDRQVVSDHTERAVTGTSVMNAKLKDTLPGVMDKLKAEMFGDLLSFIRQRRAKADEAEAAALNQASLPDLLVSSDRTVATARARNRALIAAKERDLPGILRNHPTAQLSALVVKLEQTILDLDHEAEVAKDRAQQAAAANADPAQTDELRGLAISYRERIELLKPIVASVKEEIANRNR